MSCSLHKDGPPYNGIPDLTEEFIMNCDYLPDYMVRQGWRRFRIEYGFECGCPEGVIYLPPWVDPDRVDELFKRRNDHEL